MTRDRITDKQLQQVVRRLNELTGSPETYRNDEGIINIGHFHISSAYGGVCLHRISNTSGGITTPLISYHTTKRQLYELMHAYADGYCSAIE